MTDTAILGLVANAFANVNVIAFVLLDKVDGVAG